MSNRLKDAFGQIHAEEELKNSTREFLAGKINETQKQKMLSRRRTLSYRSIAAAAACMAAVMLGVGGWRLYFEPVTAIAMEMQPAVSLGINRFDKVVSVESDSRELLDAVNVKYCDYAEAVNRILSEESTVDYLSQDEIVEISVTGGSEEKAQEILAGVEACAKRHGNIHCYRGSNAPEQNSAAPGETAQSSAPGNHHEEPETGKHGNGGTGNGGIGNGGIGNGGTENGGAGNGQHRAEKEPGNTSGEHRGGHGHGRG